MKKVIWNCAFSIAVCLVVFSEANQQSHQQRQDGAINICISCDCGVAKKNRIVGGHRASHSEFPWLIKLDYNGKAQCGASLISPNYILTAAHCVDGKNANGFSVQLADGTERTGKTIHQHSEYNEVIWDNDIAVIELNAPVKFSGSIKRVCLPRKGQDLNGTNAIVAGWGRTAEGVKIKPGNKELNKVDLPLMSIEECAESKYKPNRITKNMFCAGFIQGGKDSCQGDSGGPLHVRVNGRMVVAGIVSNGDGCARANYPGIYTKVINYLSWISQKIGGDCICI